MKIAPKLKWLVWPLKIAISTIWLCSAGIASYQILNWTPPPARPLTPWATLIGLFSVAFVWLLTRIKNINDELEYERFSAPTLLAHGYLENWVKPAITSLTEKPGGEVRFYIYLPQTLQQLEDLQIIRNFISTHNNFSMGQFPLTLPSGEARNVETVKRNGGTVCVYVDFPKTMRGLRKVVEYAIPAPEQTARETLEKKLVERFNEIVETEINKTGSLYHKIVRLIKIGNEQVDFPDLPAGF